MVAISCNRKHPSSAERAEQMHWDMCSIVSKCNNAHDHVHRKCVHLFLFSNDICSTFGFFFYSKHIIYSITKRQWMTNQCPHTHWKCTRKIYVYEAFEMIVCLCVIWFTEHLFFADLKPFIRNVNLYFFLSILNFISISSHIAGKTNHRIILLFLTHYRNISASKWIKLISLLETNTCGNCRVWRSFDYHL